MNHLSTATGAWIAIALPLLVAQTASAQPTRIVVTIENLAPQNGTFLTPFWVGFHEGVFDTYDGNTPASNDPRPGSVAMERICEDGDNSAIMEDFAELSPGGTDTTIPGPNGPIAPNDIARQSFVLDASDPNNRYFSYASMILPSNDFCISNGSPLAHPIFDEDGSFVAQDFFVTGAETLDAGTEVNDELPANTAFFGQQEPNTGVDENGVIGTIGSDLPALGFQPPGSGGVLDDPRFRMGDFLVPGYPHVKISFTAAPAVVEELEFQAALRGSNQVPPIDTRARGIGIYALRDGGTTLRFRNFSIGLRDVIGAHLHLGSADEAGPIVALLIPEDLDSLTERQRARLRFRINGSLSADDLVGPLSGQPLDALIAEIQAGNVYVNIRTSREPDGEIRGQLEPLY